VDVLLVLSKGDLDASELLRQLYLNVALLSSLNASSIVQGKTKTLNSCETLRANQKMGDLKRCQFVCAHADELKNARKNCCFIDQSCTLPG